MITEIKNAIHSSNCNIPEVVQLEKNINILEKSLVTARNAVSDRVMLMVRNGKVEELYKLKPLVDILGTNSEPIAEGTTLASDLSNRRPMKVSFLGKESAQTSWRGVSEAILEILYNSNKTAFNNMLKNSNFSANKPYIARAGEGMTAPVMLGNGAHAVYVDVARVTNNDFFFLKKIVKEMGHDENEIVITLDPNFTRKSFERTKKTKDTVKKTVAKDENKQPKKRGRKPKAAKVEQPVEQEVVNA